MAKAEKIDNENSKNAATAATILVSTVVVAVVLLTVVGIAITNMITRPVKKLQELMSRAEAGDLTVMGITTPKMSSDSLTAPLTACWPLSRIP